MPTITQLPALLQADIAPTTDVLAIVNAGVTKKVTPTAIVGAALGTTLPAAVVNASLNSITPAGGTLAVTGGLAPTEFILSSSGAEFGKYIKYGSGGQAAGIGTLTFDSPTTRMMIGDGTGYDFAFAKRSGGVTTNLVTVTDGGNVTITGLTTTDTLAATSTVKTGVYTVGTLPAAALAGAGAQAYVTDATAPVFNVAAVGGGAASVGVTSDGAAWLCS